MGRLSTLLVASLTSKLQKSKQPQSVKVAGLKRCGCGCNLWFAPRNCQHLYCDVKHRGRAYARRYRKRHNVRKRYQGMFYCPKCGGLGEVFFQFRDNGVLMRVIFAHRKRVYSEAKRKTLVKKGFSPKQILNKSVKVTKSVKDCYL